MKESGRCLRCGGTEKKGQSCFWSIHYDEGSEDNKSGPLARFIKKVYVLGFSLGLLPVGDVTGGPARLPFSFRSGALGHRFDGHSGFGFLAAFYRFMTSSMSV